MSDNDQQYEKTIPEMPCEVAKRPIEAFFLLDCSGSMSGSKIGAVNQAMREVIPALRDVVNSQSGVAMNVTVMTFDSNVQVHTSHVPVDEFYWSDVGTGGSTNTSGAIDQLCRELDISKMPRRGLPPVCILMSDGEADSIEDYMSSINNLNNIPWGKKAVRLAIAIQTSEVAKQHLSAFSNHPEVGVLEANNVLQLINMIKWASTTASISASVGRASDLGDTSSNVILPSPVNIESPDEIF